MGRAAAVREREGTGMIEEWYVHERSMPAPGVDPVNCGCPPGTAQEAAYEAVQARRRASAIATAAATATFSDPTRPGWGI